MRQNRSNDMKSRGKKSEPHLPELIGQVLKNFPDKDGENDRKVWLTIAAMHRRQCHSIELLSRYIPTFLNDLGHLSVSVSLCDLQMWMQSRNSKRKSDFNHIDGAIIDIDTRIKDLILGFELYGVPRPLAYWDTIRGHKLLYVFERPCTQKIFNRITRRLSLPWPGVDPLSWHEGTAQRLPVCLKSTPNGVVPVEFEARLVNPILLPLSAASGLPQRIASLLGSREEVSPLMRRRIDEYLEEIGIPAPETEGFVLYDRCPVCDQHDAKCCYVNRRADTSIYVHCLGGHGGEGEKSWTERKLFSLAHGDSL